MSPVLERLRDILKIGTVTAAAVLLLCTTLAALAAAKVACNSDDDDGRIVATMTANAKKLYVERRGGELVVFDVYGFQHSQASIGDCLVTVVTDHGDFPMIYGEREKNGKSYMQTYMFFPR